ncbi:MULTISPECIES: energy transducer TonB [unclassified Oceanispirochaeta]|uniref:energy transducer TonB family protein n=1 Tax=unclassified Oceanispirochaeta TaxID=2635722 RepID=UPI000E093167|nr:MULTISPECIES: energy transducer TonB [unclassified Oceanispirochaeta]MBF9017165.1 TonB family protein [Oceanispirochaeta sp. M2]NPD73614.1 TonB family protein [Oceanispirochaeta sp. M1]RDG30717.1 TonB family protein [Oceanispirochaeta sp. M1]
MTPYQQKKQNRRTLISFLAAFLFHLLIVGGVLLYDYLFVEELNEFSGPVLVKLGEPEGEDIPVLPEEDTPVNDVPEDSSTPSQASDIPDSPSDAPSVPEPVSDDAVRPATEEALLSDPSDKVEDSSPEESPLETQPETPSEPKVQIVSGEEAGNSFEYQYNSEGNVGRSLGAEIYLYMPLPQFINMDLFDKVKGDSYSPGTSRKDFILKYYKKFNEELALQYAPVTDDVRALWDYLIDAGYDYQNADYKTDGYLRPVILSFSISPEGDLLNVEIQKSSGNPDVDQAVKVGFQNAAFYNSVDREINGRFTYRFQ